MKTALVILRTPFQAWMAKQVLVEENVDEFSILYFTQEDSSEDRHYYNELLASSKSGGYIYVPKTKWDILGQLLFKNKVKGWLRDLDCNVTLLSSIDAFLPNAVMAKQKRAELVTFDDGTSNINPESVYFKESINFRGKVYRRYFGALSLEKTRQKICRHYTIHADFENIVESSRKILLTGWVEKQRLPRHGVGKRYFLGAPFFRRELDSNIIRQLEIYLASLEIDAYIRHPREAHPLDIGAPYLEKGGLIAEEAILRDAGTEPIHIVGTTSSVLFNMARIAQSRTMLLFSSSFSSMESLALKSGCEVEIFEGKR